jgi:hypothetical protein
VPRSTEELYLDALEFHPRFLATWANMSAVRFMDWNNVGIASSDWHVVNDWARRVTRDTFSYQGRAVPVESMVHLANILGADPWINIHAEAPMSVVRSMAALVAGTLRPDLSPLLERSNEAWAAGSPPGDVTAAAAAARGVAVGTAHAQMSAEIAAAWDAGWGGTGPLVRLVLSTFTAVPWYTGMMLATRVPCSLFPPSRAAALFPHGCPNAGASFPAWHAAVGIGVTAYFGCNSGGDSGQAAATAALTVDQLLTLCETLDASPSAAAHQWDGHLPLLAAAFAADGGDVHRPLPLIVYEGGPGLVELDAILRGGQTAGLTALLIAANRSPRMEGLFRGFLDGCNTALDLSAGRHAVLPFMVFASMGLPTLYGSWGLYEHMGQRLDTAPKARALIGFVDDITRNLTRSGCHTPSASNYDPSAPLDDASACVFPPAPVPAAGGLVAFAGVPLSVGVPSGAAGASVSFTVAVAPSSAIPALSATLGSSGSAWAAAASAINATGSNASATASTAAAAATGALAVGTYVYRLGPAGLHFQSPVNACIAVNLTDVAAYGWGPAGASVGGAGVRLSFYFSQDATIWTPSEVSLLGVSPDGTTATLCGLLWHFTYVAGMVVNTTAHAAAVAVASACNALGAWCAPGGSVVRPCNVGRFGDSGGQTVPACSGNCTCVLGSYCPAGSTTPGGCLACPQGSWCAGGGAAAVPCAVSAGHYCPPNGSSAAGLVCPAGAWCAGASAAPATCSGAPGTYCPLASSQNGGSPCPMGAWCAGGAAAARPCAAAAGWYCPPSSSSSAGTTCPVGSACGGGASAPTVCAVAGYYCGGGAASATGTMCAAGRYGTAAGAAVCASDTCEGACQCPSGYYCGAGSTSASASCVACPAGSWCGGASAIPQTCSGGPGTTCPPASSSQNGLACSAGSYCVGGSAPAVACSGAPGTHCPASSSINGAPCPAGSSCSGGAAPAVPCTGAGGTYCPASCATNGGIPCPQGSFCAGATAQPVVCTGPAGTSCPSGSATDGLPCEIGSFCTGGAAAATPCAAAPAGRYCAPSSSTANSAAPCPAGSACAGGAAAPVACSCSAGYFCPLGGVSVGGVPCPQGSSCAGGSSLPVACSAPGCYCPVASSSAASSLCAAGHWGSASGAASYNSSACGGPCACIAGSYCAASSTSPVDACVPCPARQSCAGGAALPGGLACMYVCLRQ